MQKSKFFTYSWHIDESQEEFTCIRIYGLNKKNKNVCVRVDDFTPYVYLELPTRIRWTATKAQLLGDKLDSLMGRQKPVKKALTWKKKLYGAHINSDTGERQLFPYLFCSFYNIKDLTLLGFRLKGSVHVVGLGALKLKIHESAANPILQMICCRKISTAGWIKFQGRRIREEDMETLCDYEYNVKCKHLEPYNYDIIPQPKIMGFDIEVNSSNPSMMPQSQKKEDKVFQISCVLAREGDKPDDYEKYLLTLGNPEEKIVGYDVIVYTYETEAQMLIGFIDLIREENPNIITGYNILGFDIPYMMARAKSPACCMREFSKQGFHKYAQAKEKIISWSSSAYKNQEFEFLDAEGRVYVDLLPLVRRDFKFNNYKLKTISTYFLGQTKDPLSVKGIFKCYRIGVKKNKDGEYGKKSRRAMAVVGKYCLAKNTAVTGKHGNIAIQNLYNKNINVLSWNEKTNGIQLAKQSNFFDNGKKECIQLELEDGRTITCTPDHKIATKSVWMKADNIKIGARIKVGPVMPNVDFDTKETIYARVLGYVFNDIYLTKNHCILYSGSKLDIKLLAEDIKNITGYSPNIIKDRYCWYICLPQSIRSKIINKNNDLIMGITLNSILPKTVGWSKSQKREFLGGLFGRNGTYTAVDLKLQHFFPIRFSQTRNKKKVLQVFMKQLQKLLGEFGITSSYRIRRINKLYKGTLAIPLFASDIFMRNVGYRYCFTKTMRSSIYVMYQRIKNKIIESARKKGQSWKKFPNVTQFLRENNLLQYFSGHGHSLSKSEVFELKLVAKKRVGIKQVFDITVDETHSLLANGIVAHNCVQDSVLVVRLMDKLKTWIGLTEMASTCNVPIFTLYTQGQQIKVFSQLYKHCMYQNIVVEKDAYKVADDERYVGAKVFLPVPGKYKMVVPFDFASLYPTTIIAYNIDYHTWVPDDSPIPDHKCHVMEWEDHIACIHDPKVQRKLVLTQYLATERAKIKVMRERRNKCLDKLRRKEMMVEINEAVAKLKPYTLERSEISKTISKFPMCAKRRYRFLKEPKGVMPTVIQNLLDARKHTRKVDMAKVKNDIAILEKEDKDNTQLIISKKGLLDVLNKRQLAFKVSANSMYGAMGVRRGYLPFMPGAMCISKESQISTGYGFTRRLGDIDSAKYLWSYNEGQCIANGKAIQYKGIQKVVKITLQDGRVLRCTPEHKILTTCGWMEARSLSAKYNWDDKYLTTNDGCSKLLMGLDLPEDIIGNDEKEDWNILGYNMNTSTGREIALAWARIIGFLITDRGNINKYYNEQLQKDCYSCTLYIGTKIGANMIAEDIFLLGGTRPKISRFGKTFYNIYSGKTD